MRIISVLLFIGIVITACSPHRQIEGIISRTVTDTIEYYQTEIDVWQKNYMHLLIGKWEIDTMRRQARMEPEPLTDVFLIFNTDSTFTGKASCNHITGRYTVKGTGIRFSNIASTKMACDRLEQEYEFLRLLQERVSTYTVNENRLWLRDNSSNIIFSAVPKR